MNLITCINRAYRNDDDYDYVSFDYAKLGSRDVITFLGNIKSCN